MVCAPPNLKVGAWAPTPPPPLPTPLEYTSLLLASAERDLAADTRIDYTWVRA